MLDGQPGHDQHQRTGRGDAYPGRLQPPVNPPQRQHRAQQGHAGGENAEGQEVEFFKGLEAVARRQFEQEHAAQADQRQAQFKQIQPAPFGNLQQVFGEQARQRQRQLRRAQPQYQGFHAPFRRERLDHVVQAQRTQRRAHHAVGRPHRNGGIQVIDEQVAESHQRIQHQEHFGKRTQAELLAKLHQQQVHAHVGHHIGSGQPGHFGGGRAQGTLQVLQVGDNQRVAEPASDRDQHTDHRKQPTLVRGVQRRRGRAGQARPLVGLPGVGGVFVHSMTLMSRRARSVERLL